MSRQALSWYIRPLLVYSALVHPAVLLLRVQEECLGHGGYGRGCHLQHVLVSITGHERPDSTASTLLAAVERRWITGPLTLAQFVLTAVIPIWFMALAASLRRRLWLAAALVIAVGTALKVAWSYVGGASAWIIVPPVAWEMRWLRAS